MPQSAIPPSRHAPIRQDWLDKRREEIIEPDLAIVDPHHHMWDRPGNRYLFEDLLADVGTGHKRGSRSDDYDGVHIRVPVRDVY